MKIKTNLRFGFGFLFMVVIFFGGISLCYMNKVSASSKMILKDNYESFKSTRAMREILYENALPFSDALAYKLTKQLGLEH